MTDEEDVNPPKRFDIEEPDESSKGIKIIPPDDLSGEEESNTGSQEQTKRAS